MQRNILGFFALYSIYIDFILLSDLCCNCHTTTTFFCLKLKVLALKPQGHKNLARLLQLLVAMLRSRSFATVWTTRTVPDKNVKTILWPIAAACALAIDNQWGLLYCCATMLDGGLVNIIDNGGNQPAAISRSDCPQRN